MDFFTFEEDELFFTLLGGLNLLLPVGKGASSADSFNSIILAEMQRNIASCSNSRVNMLPSSVAGLIAKCKREKLFYTYSRNSGISR